MSRQSRFKTHVGGFCPPEINMRELTSSSELFPFGRTFKYTPSYVIGWSKAWAVEGDTELPTESLSLYVEGSDRHGIDFLTIEATTA